MRKKTVSNFFDNIFWYILYAFPIIAYLFYCFVPIDYEKLPEAFDSPIYEYQVNSNLIIDYQESEESSIFDFTSLSSYIAFIPSDVSPLDVLSSLVNNGELSNSVFLFDTLVWQYDLTDDSIEDINNDFFEFYNLLNPLTVPLFIFDIRDGILTTSRNNISFYSSFDFENFLSLSSDYTCYVLFQDLDNFLNFIPLGDFSSGDLSSLFTVQSYSSYNLKPSFSSFFKQIGFGFASDNIVVNSLEEIFGANGVMPIFSTDTPFIIFAWFICVFLIHLVVDFLLFLPRLAHKWMNEFGGD